MTQRQLDRLTKRYLPLLLLACVAVTTVAHHLTTPLPPSLSIAGLLAFDALIALATIPLLYHCVRTLGTAHGLLFFYTSAVFTGCQESLWVFLGRLGVLGETYAFTTGFLWFFGLPANVCLGWFVWNYAGYFLVKSLFPDASPIKIAALNGLMAVSLDLWMDPVTVNMHLVSHLPNFWNWAQTNSPTLFTVPIYNFWGWFFGVGVFTFIYETSWGRRGRAAAGKNLVLLYFLKLALGWAVLFIGVKIPQLLLETVIPGYTLCPLVFEAGHQPTLSTWLLLAIVPTLMLACIVVCLRRSRKDWGLLFTYFFCILINLGMAYSLQLAFPGSPLIFLVIFPTCFPLGLLLYYLTHATSTSEAPQALRAE